MSDRQPQGHDTDEYRNKACKAMDVWSDEMLLNLRLRDEADARMYLGAANEYDRSEQVVKHFVDEIKRLKQ